MKTKRILILLITAAVFTAAIISGTVVSCGKTGAAAAEVNIRIRHVISGEEYDSNEVYTFMLTPCGDDAPMPAGTEGDAAEICISGEGYAEFSSITYDHPGLYKYKVSRKTGSHENIREDDTEYMVTVTALNDGTTDIVAWKGSKKSAEESRCKSEEIVFSDRYVPDYERHPPKTGDEETAYKMIIYSGYALLCAEVLIIMIRRRRKKRCE